MRASSGGWTRPLRAAAVTAAMLSLIAGCQNTATFLGGKTSGNRPVAIERPPAKPSPPARTVAVPRPTPALPVPPPLPPAPSPTQPSSAASGITLTPPAGIAQQIRVALLLPLSGPRAALGQSLLDAALLAQFEIADGDFILMPFDTGGTVQGAENAAALAVGAGAKLVIGPVFSDAVAGAAPVVLQSGINMLAFSNDSAVARAGVYVSGLLPETQIARVVGFAAGRGVRRIAALLPDGPFGTRVRDALVAATASVGGELVDVRFFGGSGEDIAATVRGISDYDRRRAALKRQISELSKTEDEVSRRALARLKRMETLGPVDFDALLVAASGDQLTNIAAQLGNFDIDTKRVRLLGLASWAAEQTGREPALVGSWFAAAPQAQSIIFKRDFSAMFEAQPHPLALATYDMVSLAAILASAEGGPAFDRSVLQSESGFAGAGSVFRFLPSGLSERLLEIREVQPWGSKIVDRSPQNFEKLTN